MSETNNGKNWFNSILNQFMGSTNCPEFDVLVAYHKDNVSLKIERQIEGHLLDCELCSSVVESLPLVVNLNRIDEEVEQVKEKIRNYNRAEGPPAPSVKTSEKKPARIRRQLGRMQPILSSPIFRYSLAAAFLTLIFYNVAVQYLTPQYYDIASLNPEEQNMLLLDNESQRGDWQRGAELSQGAFLLLNAEQKKWGLIPSFEVQRVQQAISHLLTAIETSTEPFYHNKYAYFLGKAYLMQSDVVTARQWLEKVVNAPSSKAYHQAASRLLKRLH